MNITFGWKLITSKVLLFLLLFFVTGTARIWSQGSTESICLTAEFMETLEGEDSLFALRPALSTSCDTTSIVFHNLIKHKESFMPYSLDVDLFPQLQLKKIKVRLVILEADPLGVQTNFRGNNSFDILWLVGLINSANNWLSNMEAPNLPPPYCSTNNCYIIDSKIRLELTGIEFFQDPTPNYGVGGLHEPGTNTSGYRNFGKYKDSILNIYFVHNATYGMGAWASTGVEFEKTGASQEHYLVTRNYYSAQASFADEAKRLVHELGHSIGPLFHWKEFVNVPTSLPKRQVGHRDFLTDVYNIMPPPGNGLDNNNFMFGNNPICRYFSPMQLGIMHRSLHIGSAKKYAYPVALTDKDWVISNNQTWDFPIRLFEDIVVQNGATLTIKCQVQMPPGSRVLVKKGGKLIIDGGHLTSYHQKTRWNGIELEGDKTKTPILANQGSLELKNGAIIENAWSGVRNFTWDNGAYGGGVINAENATFYNCWKAVELNDYPNYVYSNNSCYFKNVSFLIDDMGAVANSGGPFGAQFSSWNVRGGVHIENCVFSNDLSFTQLPVDKRDHAIESSYSGMYVKSNQIKGFRSGVYAYDYTGTAGRTMNIFDNIIRKTPRNIIVGANAYSDVRGNDIDEMVHDENPFVQAYGIYLDNTIGAHVRCGNFVNGRLEEGDSDAGTGVIANNTYTSGAVIIDNSFSQLFVGVQTQKDNRNLNVVCNDFAYVGAGINANPQSSGSSYYMKTQGGGCGSTEKRAGNTFRNSSYGILSWLTNSWGYSAFQGNGNNSQLPFPTFGSVQVLTCYFPVLFDPNSQCGKPISCPGPDGGIPGDGGDGPLNRSMGEVDEYGTIDEQLAFGDAIRAFNAKDDRRGLIAFLEARQVKHNLKLLIPLYIEDNQFEKADKAISSLGLSPEETKAYQEYYDIIKSLQKDSRRINKLDAKEYALIERLSKSDFGVSAFAKALLKTAYNAEWIHVVEELPMLPMSKKTQQTQIVSLAKSRLDDAVPNPTEAFTMLGAYINEEDALLDPVLILRNMAGVEVWRQALLVGDNEFRVSTTSLSPGLYIYSLNMGNKVCESKKVTVVR